MEASIQAVSPELIWELRMTEGSVVEGAGGEGSAHAKGVHSASKPNRNHRDITVITRLPSTGMVSKWRWRRARRCGCAELASTAISIFVFGTNSTSTVSGKHAPCQEKGTRV